MGDAAQPSHPGCCPHYHRAVELIGRRWTGAIVAVLMTDGPCRFSELRQAVPGVSDRVLSQRMRELEAVGVIARTVEAGPPVRVHYGLTPKGRDLREVVHALQRWGRRWVDAVSCEAASSAAGATPVERDVAVG